MEQKKIFAKIINFRPIFYAFLGLLFGIVCAEKIFHANITYIVLVAVCFAALGAGCIFYKKWVPFVLVLVSFWVGVGGYFLAYTTFTGKEYLEKQEIIGRVTDGIYDADGYYNVILDDCYIGGDSVKGISVYIYKSDDTIIENGDIISFTGYANQVKLWELGDFNSYYIRNNVAYTSTTNTANISLIDGRIKLDEKIRASIKDKLFSYMPEDNASIAYATLTGDRTYICEDVENNYQSAGIIHLLCISGLHISFLVAVLAWILKKCKVNKYVILGVMVVFLLFYSYMCGWTPSVIRASVMAIVLMLAPIFGKEYDNLTSLGIAGIILLLVNPLYGLDLGFLMSFGCVFSIFALERPLEKVFRRILPNYFAGAIAVTLSAQLGIIPFLVAFSGELNLLTIIANVLIIPIFSLNFILTICFSILSFIPYVGYILKLPEYILYGINYVAKFFAGTSAKISVSELDPFISAVYFAGVFSLSYFLMVSRKIKLLLISGMLCFASIFGVCKVFGKSGLSNEITSITYYGESSYILTNENNDVVVIASDFNSLHKKYLQKNRIYKVDYFLNLDDGKDFSIDELRALREYDVKEIYSTKEFSGATEENIIAGNTSSFAGDFVFEYVVNNGRNIGIKIKYKNNQIFFATNENLSYNNTEKLKSEISRDYDIVFLGNKCYYSDSITDKLTFGTYFDENLDYCYAHNGNLVVNIENKFVKEIDW